MVVRRLVLERIHRLVEEAKIVERRLVLERIHRSEKGGGGGGGTSRGRWSLGD